MTTSSVMHRCFMFINRICVMNWAVYWSLVAVNRVVVVNWSMMNRCIMCKIGMIRSSVVSSIMNGSDMTIIIVMSNGLVDWRVVCSMSVVVIMSNSLVDWRVVCSMSVVVIMSCNIMKRCAMIWCLMSIVCMMSKWFSVMNSWCLVNWCVETIIEDRLKSHAVGLESLFRSICFESNQTRGQDGCCEIKHFVPFSATKSVRDLIIIIALTTYL